jgi:Sec-independent protein translocase protein (TatC)
MQQPIIQALRHHGIGGGLMWRNLRYSILVIFILAAVITPTADILNMCLFRRPDGGALRHQYRRGVAGTFPTQAASRSRLAGVAMPSSVRLP